MVLLPLEHLSESGLSPAFASILIERGAWDRARVEIFDRAFHLFVSRTRALRDRMTTWPALRWRHVAVVREPVAVRPYAQLLNTNAWLLDASDLDPERSHPELAAFLLAQFEWMAASGEVTQAAVRSAAWWLERTDAECDAFAAAARAATRPDADGLRAVAEALPWLRALHHEQLRPAPPSARCRALPGTGLLVPAALEERPPALVARVEEASRAALASFRQAWRRPATAELEALVAWLADAAPPLLIVGSRTRVLWDPQAAQRVDPVREALRHADAVAVAAIRADLEVVVAHTRRFLAAFDDWDRVPAAADAFDPGGYAHLDPARRLVVYDVHEPGIERLHGPPLPWARAMLGARTAHEWGHVADLAGLVGAFPDALLEALAAELADALDRVVDDAPRAIRLRADPCDGAILARVVLARLPDYRANLVARHFMDRSERETYARHNVRCLAAEVPAARIWWRLARYLYEYQYLGPHLALVELAEPLEFFFRCTGLDDDRALGEVLTRERFAEVAALVARICRAHAIDSARLRLPTSASQGG